VARSIMGMANLFRQLWMFGEYSKMNVSIYEAFRP